MSEVLEPEPPAPDFGSLAIEAAFAFTPRTPVRESELFAGDERRREVQKLVLSMIEPGAIVVFGERGVGKTSAVTLAEGLVRPHRPVIHIVGSAGAAYGTLWKNALREVVLTTQVEGIGFGAEAKRELRSAADHLDERADVADVLTVLKRLPGGGKIVFTFDEFDRLEANTTTTQFADTIKAVTDYGLAVTMVLVGVGDDLGDLLQAHQSIERSIRTVHLSRMHEEELRDIVDRGAARLGMQIVDAAREHIVRVSRGLPHYTHLLGLHATRAALDRRTLVVGMPHVVEGSYDALHEVEASVREHYKAATASGRKDATYAQTLTACAMTVTDEQGYFRPVDVCRPLARILGKDAPLGSFSPKLAAFTSAGRGEVLTTNNRGGRPRYRFTNPLLQPYVIIQALKDGMLKAEMLASHTG